MQAFGKKICERKEKAFLLNGKALIYEANYMSKFFLYNHRLYKVYGVKHLFLFVYKVFYCFDEFACFFHSVNDIFLVYIVKAIVIAFFA